MVVDRGELVEQVLELGDGGGLLWLGAERLFEGLLEAFDLAAGGGLVGAAGFLLDVATAQLRLQGVAAAAAAGKAVVKTIPLSVNVEAGTPKRATAARKRSRTIGPVRGWWAVTSRA